jgi:hypothetical protein
MRAPIPISGVAKPIIQLVTLDFVGRKPTKKLREEALAQKVTALNLGTPLFKRKNIIHIIPDSRSGTQHFQERRSTRPRRLLP